MRTWCFESFTVFLCFESCVRGVCRTLQDGLLLLSTGTVINVLAMHRVRVNLIFDSAAVLWLHLRWLCPSPRLPPPPSIDGDDKRLEFG